MGIHVEPHRNFQGVFWATLEDGSRRLATKNLAPEHSVYGERLLRFKGIEYRIWDAFRSKLAAAILKDLVTVPIKLSSKVLYLGAASGTTVSHVSDIVGDEGFVYCVEFASRSIRDLINNVCAFRPNTSPIFADARLPEQYAALIEKVDAIYCDVAQPEQALLLANNAKLFLKEDGWVMLAVKSQSIDVTKRPSEVYKEEANVLKNRGFRIEQVVPLEPYDKAHAMILAERAF